MRDEREVKHALRCASILPFAEAILIFIRWAGIAWLSVVVPLYLKGYLPFDLLIFGGNILGMTGLSGMALYYLCLLYTSDAADDLLCVDLGGRRNIKKKKLKKHPDNRIIRPRYIQT